MESRGRMRLNNEFALIELERDYSANGVRLKITSNRTGRVAYLDPLQLEVLTWLPVEEYLRYMETPFGPEEEDLSAVPEMQPVNGVSRDDRFGER